MTTKAHLLRALTVATVLAASVIGATGPASAAPQKSCLVPTATKQSDDPNATAKALDRAVAEMRIAGRADSVRVKPAALAGFTRAGCCGSVARTRTP